VRLKQGKHLLVVRNTFAPEHPPVNLVDLPPGMMDENVQFVKPDLGDEFIRADLLTGLFRQR